MSTVVVVSWADAVKALNQIQALVHQRTPRTEPPTHHWQRDFDEIRRLCEKVIGPYERQP